MRNRIFGSIGVLWGGFILLRWLERGCPLAGASAYGLGQNLGLFFGMLLFVSGLYYLIKGGGKPRRRR